MRRELIEIRKDGTTTTFVYQRTPPESVGCSGWLKTLVARVRSYQHARVQVDGNGNLRATRDGVVS